MSTLKVSNIQDISNNAAMSISGGVVTFTNAPSVITLGTAQASTSGTSIDFTGIPSTAKRISIMFRGVSSAASDVAALVQIGTSSGLKTSGYLSTTHWGGGGTDDATGFAMYGIGASNILSGIMTIAHMGSNIYVSSHAGKYNSSNGMFGGGDVDLGGT